MSPFAFQRPRQSNGLKQPVLLQVLPELRTGGVERGTVEIAGAAARAGWKSLVASAGGQMLPQLAYAGGEHITLPLQSKNPFKIYENAAALEKVIRERKVDIVHARSRAPAWSAYLAAQRTGVKFVTTFHGIYGIQSNLKKKYNSVMVKGDRVIAISYFCANHIHENYELDERKMRIIQRGVDLKAFNPNNIVAQRLLDLTSEWRMPDELPLIIMPGRLTRWKGQHVLVKALATLPHRRFFCALIGDDMGHPTYRVELENMIIELGLEGHVRIVGNTSFMPEAYTLADVVVCPSVEPEAFGRIAIEAQAMGKPVIATNHGGAVETVIPGETGWLCIPGDPETLAKAITEALNLTEERKEYMKEYALWNARENFSSQKMCDATLAVYKELL